MFGKLRESNFVSHLVFVQSKGHYFETLKWHWRVFSVISELIHDLEKKNQTWSTIVDYAQFLDNWSFENPKLFFKKTSQMFIKKTRGHNYKYDFQQNQGKYPKISSMFLAFMPNISVKNTSIFVIYCSVPKKCNSPIFQRSWIKVQFEVGGGVEWKCWQFGTPQIRRERKEAIFMHILPN